MPDFYDFPEIILIAIPLKGHIIEPCPHNAEGKREQQQIQHHIKIVAALSGQQKSDEKPRHQPKADKHRIPADAEPRNAKQVLKQVWIFHANLHLFTPNIYIIVFHFGEVKQGRA